jgi:hypothetical protein
MVELTVNGGQRSVDVAPETPLLSSDQFPRLCTSQLPARRAGERAEGEGHGTKVDQPLVVVRQLGIRPGPARRGAPAAARVQRTRRRGRRRQPPASGRHGRASRAGPRQPGGRPDRRRHDPPTSSDSTCTPPTSTRCSSSSPRSPTASEPPASPPPSSASPGSQHPSSSSCWKQPPSTDSARRPCPRPAFRPHRRGHGCRDLCKLPASPSPLSEVISSTL